LVTCDLIGLTAEFSNTLREVIARSLGTTPDQVVVACAHNHSGPAMLGFIAPEHVDPGYLDFLSSRLVELCREADDKREPALLGTGLGEETTVSEYRRLLTRDGGIVMNWEEYPQEEIVGPVEEGDPDLGVVRIAATTGPTIAVVFNYATHPNSMPGDNFTITADFPGYAADLIEAELGGIALFTNGAQGSVDIEGFEGRDFQGVERRVKALGGAVLEVCRRIGLRPDPVIRSARRVFLLPYRQVAPETLGWAQEVAGRATGEAVTLRDGISDEIKADNILRHVGRSKPGVDFEMVGIRLGTSVFFTVPGELFTEIGKRMKTLSPTLQTHIIGLANGYVGYIATAKASAEGGYATDVASGSYFVENAEDIICKNTEILLTNLQ
jgi:neutral ceramidase